MLQDVYSVVIGILGNNLKNICKPRERRQLLYDDAGAKRYHHLQRSVFSNLVISLVVRALDYQSNGRFKSTGWLHGLISLSSFRGRSNEHQELLGA